MPGSIVLDTDFASSFIKIGRLDLVREFYGVKRVFLPSAVRRELSAADLDTPVVSLDWVCEQAVDEAACDALRRQALPTRLGAGGAASIVLAKSLHGPVLLISDSAARRIAQKEGVTCVDIPAFLLACKRTGFVDPQTVGEIVEELRSKDRYAFRADVLSLLLT